MKRVLILLLLLFGAFVLSACDKETPIPTPEPTIFDIEQVPFQNTTVKLSEAPYSEFSAFGLNKSMDLTQRGNVIFAFESAVSTAERAACIQTTELILNRIGIAQPLQICVYAKDGYAATFVDSGTIYTHIQNWNAPEYICTLLQGLLGEYCHYGAVSGYANYLCNELWGDSLPVCGEGWQFASDADLLDLNLLCFRPAFYDGKDIKAAKRLANTFASRQIGTMGEAAFLELLEQSGTLDGIGEFCGVLSEFYHSLGLDHDPSQILYRPGGQTYDYIVKTPYAVMYIQKDWVDKNMDLCPYTYEGFLHENYPDTKQYFTRSVQDMAQYQQLFDLGPYNNDLAICFSNTAARDSSYSVRTHSICLQNTGSLMNNYVHALTWDYCIPQTWAHIGGAYYYSSYYDYYGIAMRTVDYNSSSRKCFLELRENLGRDMDMATDFLEVFHVFAYACSFDDPNDGNGYIAGASFIGYLITCYGEERVIEILFKTHDFGEASYEELVVDWQNFLEDNYTGYTKIK